MSLPSPLSALGPFGLLIRGGLWAALGLLVASIFFTEARELGAAALIALGLGPTLTLLLDKNRADIWEAKVHPAQANRSCALSLTLLFISALLAAGAAARLAPTELAATSFANRYQNSWQALLEHNFYVLIAGGIFAALYRANGLMLLLGYNAVHWGAQFSDYFSAAFTEHGTLAALTLFATLCPHALFEVLCYILTGMAGTFLSLASAKYSPGSPEFRRVAKAGLYLFLAGIASLLLATTLEVSLAAPVFHKILG